MTTAIGIDLGTTYTVLAAIIDGRPTVIPNAEGQRLTPSVVAFTLEGRPLVGQMAKRQAAANPQRTVFSIKRRMGSDYQVSIGNRSYTPQQLSSLILAKVKGDAEVYLGEQIETAVITVPAYFSEPQRQATKEAGAMAGLEVLRIINEPTAAALAYGLDREVAHTVLVWDLGGGTFDVSILELGESIFEVRAVSGNTYLGGDDYDQRVMDYLAQQYRQASGVDFPGEAMARQMLREAAEKAKIDLSTRLTTTVYLPLRGGSAPDAVGTATLELTLTRHRFQELTRPLLEQMLPPTRQALADAGLEPRDIDRVLLVGGATRMPAVLELARQLFGGEPYQGLNPDEVVATGAAIQAGMLMGVLDKAVLLDVLPLSLGLETLGGLFTRVILRNTPLPASAAHIFTTAADNQTSVNIHVLQGERELAQDNISLGQVELSDLPPLSRGVAKIEVDFQVDVDGIVHISATDLLTENAASLLVLSAKGLRPEAVQRMLAEAESMALRDGEQRERIEAGIQAENAIAAAGMALEAAYRSRMAVQAREIEQAIFQVKQALATGQSNQILGQSKRLRELLEAISKTLTPLIPLSLSQGEGDKNELGGIPSETESALRTNPHQRADRSALWTLPPSILK